MRYVKYLFLIIIAVALICVALANRGMVTLTLMPAAIGELVGMNMGMQVPLFVVIFAGVAAGLLIGFIWEWLREMKHRTAVKTEHKQVVRLEREVSRLKADKNKDQDDVLALLDDAR